MLDTDKSRECPNTAECKTNAHLTKNQPEASRDTQNWVPPNPTSNLSNTRDTTLVRSPSLQDFFTENCTQLVSCPNPSCDYFFETSGTGESKRIYLPDGAEPSQEAVEHYQKYRYRCRKCNEEFCSNCKKIPYHEGFTCEEYTKDASSVHCRFCDKLLSERDPAIIQEQLLTLTKNVNTTVDNTCENCIPKLEATHQGTLPCKHQKYCTSNHLGSCPPCIHPDCVEDGMTLEDDCQMCGINRLKNSPIIRLKCSHVFHYDCVIDRLSNKWNTYEVNLKFTQCPLCNQNISAFFKQWDDNQLLQEVAGFRQHLRHLISNQVLKDNISLTYPETSDLFLEEGLRILNFYECYSCKCIYFGGTRVCGEAGVNVSPEELICSSCRNHCEIHGTDQMIYKCRFCCAVASFFCFGHTHFCESCHANAYELLQGSNQGYLRTEVPQCPGKEKCPLQIEHPPNGEEFAIGCALCKQDTGKLERMEDEALKENSGSVQSSNATFTIQIQPPDAVPMPQTKQKSKKRRRKRKH